MCLHRCCPLTQESFFGADADEEQDAQVQPKKKKQKVSDGLWRQKHQAMRAKHGLDEFSQPWFEAGKTARGLESERARDFVNVAFGTLQKTVPPGESALQYTLDISQCITRKPWSARVRNLTTSSQLFSLAQDRLVSSPEHFRILGLENVNFSAVSSFQTRELAGQAMAAPCIAVPLLCAIASLRELWSE